MECKDFREASERARESKRERKVLVTGAAGFVGFHLCQELFKQGWCVVGWDTSRVHYPTTTIREHRLQKLRNEAPGNFTYKDVNIESSEEVSAAWDPSISHVCHLAARAGVRESLSNPSPYIHTNVAGHFHVMEMCRQTGVEHFLYASSSSVYGSDSKVEQNSELSEKILKTELVGKKEKAIFQVPFSEDSPCNAPVSLYAATKKADELLSYSYSHLFRLPATGLRFFTVYGPWGRPDMAVYDFARRISKGLPLEVFNYGNNRRAYTYVDDIVGGIIAALNRPPVGKVPHRVFNIGTTEMVTTERLIQLLEKELAKSADRKLVPPLLCDMLETCADITELEKEVDYRPKIEIDEGISRFIGWFREFHGKEGIPLP